MKQKKSFEFDKSFKINNVDPKLYSYKDIDWAKVIFCKAEGSYTKVFFENEKEITYSKRLAIICSNINTKLFFRCHRKFVVNITKIQKIQFSTHSRIYLTNKIFVPISLRKKSLFKKIIGKYILEN